MSYVIDPSGVETGVINELVDFTGKRVLEVGCGDGRMTWRFAGSAASVLAVDVKEERIEMAKKTTPEHLEGKVRFEVKDITHTPLDVGEFEVAVLAYSL